METWLGRHRALVAAGSTSAAAAAASASPVVTGLTAGAIGSAGGIATGRRVFRRMAGVEDFAFVPVGAFLCLIPRRLLPLLPAPQPPAAGGAAPLPRPVLSAVSGGAQASRTTASPSASRRPSASPGGSSGWTTSPHPGAHPRTHSSPPPTRPARPGRRSHTAAHDTPYHRRPRVRRVSAGRRPSSPRPPAAAARASSSRCVGRRRGSWSSAPPSRRSSPTRRASAGRCRRCCFSLDIPVSPFSFAALAAGVCGAGGEFVQCRRAPERGLTLPAPRRLLAPRETRQVAQTAVKEGLMQTAVAGLLSAIALPMQLNSLSGIIDNSWVRRCAAGRDPGTSLSPPPAASVVRGDLSAPLAVLAVCLSVCPQGVAMSRADKARARPSRLFSPPPALTRSPALIAAAVPPPPSRTGRGASGGCPRGRPVARPHPIPPSPPPYLSPPRLAPNHPHTRPHTPQSRRQRRPPPSAPPPLRPAARRSHRAGSAGAPSL